MTLALVAIGFAQNRSHYAIATSGWMFAAYGMAVVSITSGIVAFFRYHREKADDSAPMPNRIRRRVINAENYAPVVHGRTFQKCEIRGRIHLPGSDIRHSKWTLGTFEVVADEAVLGVPVAGATSFVGCKFRKCEFVACTAVGTTAQIASLRHTFGIYG